jgi:hypothetical protein
MIFERLVDVAGYGPIRSHDTLPISAVHSIDELRDMRPRPIGAETVSGLRFEEPTAANAGAVAFLDDRQLLVRLDRILDIHTYNAAESGTRRAGLS